MKNLPLSCCLQDLLWRCGVHWHTFRNECTRDFLCCIDKHSPEDQEILRALARLRLRTPTGPASRRQRGSDTELAAEVRS